MKKSVEGGVRASTAAIPRGRPVSGRVWKSQQRQRFSSMRKDKAFNTSFDVKMKEKQAIREARDHDRALKAARKKTLEDKRKLMEENKKRREANARKSEVVQTIRNPAKLRRLKKKQLRNIEKR